LEKNSIHFAFQNGKIEQLCSSPDEVVWVTNVKRGILSMIQVVVEELEAESESVVQEVTIPPKEFISIARILFESRLATELLYFIQADVNGKCRTQYRMSVPSNGDGTVVTKTKDLGLCSHRQTQVIPFQIVPYTTTNRPQGMTLLTGNVQCRQVIRNNLFETVQCVETQQFKPFEDSRSGAKSEVVQTLEFSTSYKASSSKKGVYVEKNRY
jgi:hypothetical protein